MDSAGNPYTDQRSMSPGSTDLSSGGGSPPLAGMQQPPMLSPSPGVPIGDDEIIPTAIVIKNIPFNVKRETLLDIIVSLIGLEYMQYTKLYIGIALDSDAVRVQLPPRPERLFPRPRIRQLPAVE